MKFGAAGLSQAEILAVLLGTGTKGRSVLRIAEELVERHGAQGLAGLSLDDWTGHRGVGRVKAAQMLAAFELGRRLLVPAVEEPRVSSPAEAYALVRDLRRARKEHLVSLYLDAQNRLICRETVSIGSLNTTRTHPREVLQPAIVNSALAFILVHNHPSGSLDPSRDDVEFTRTMARAGDLMGISLYDHLIVSRRGYVSLKERGLL
jgi:DNA repair protein RadC